MTADDMIEAMQARGFTVYGRSISPNSTNVRRVFDFPDAHTSYPYVVVNTPAIGAPTYKYVQLLNNEDYYGPDDDHYEFFMKYIAPYPVL